MSSSEVDRLLGPMLIMTIGLPRTGKSTVARQYAEREATPVVSHAEIYQALTGGISIPDVEDQVQRVVRDTLGWYLLNGQTVVYDAMNLSRERRAPLLEMANALGFPVYGIWVSCRPSTQIERFGNRERALALQERLRGIWEPPKMEEGFFLVTTVFTDPDPEGGPAFVMEEF